MLFVLESKTDSKPKYYPYVVLTQDNWDDYGYKTLFSAELHLSKCNAVKLGYLKILQLEQTGGYTKLPKSPFEKLGEEFCSLGTDMSYYENLIKEGENIYEQYLKGICDVTFDDTIKANFEDLQGYKVSLLRIGGAERIVADARKLFKRTTKPPPRRRHLGFKVKFKTKVAPDSNSFTIDFDFQRKRSLPNRINVIIGYNGTGKTRLLANLAIVASGYGYSKKEDILDQAAGRFVGNNPPFKTVIVVSYSAFDTFVIPGRTKIEKQRMKAEGDIFGYAYCGLREHAPKSEAEDDGHAYRLKTPKEIEQEFLGSLNRLRNADRLDSLLEIIRPLLNDSSFLRTGLTQLYSGAAHDNVQMAQMFRGLSSGHKVVMKIITDLAAHMDGTQPTLVLLDEPETHLHPPLLAAFLKSIRLCLKYFDGYAVIATHSPVVLQETPSRFVRVLRRFAARSEIVPTSIETFGESIGVITQEVFNLDDSSTDWHSTLRKMAPQLELEEIEEMFGRKLGFAARSEVRSLRKENGE